MGSWKQNDTIDPSLLQDKSSDFDPVNLLSVGLADLRERSHSLECLRRSRTVASGRRYAPSFYNRIHPDEPKRLKGSPARSISKSEHINPDIVPEEYYSSLVIAPHASLMHIVMLYHQAMCKYGHTDEASRIANLLEGLKDVAETDETISDLRGIDLLLKDGLLAFYLRIQPYLPQIPSQIVKFKSLTYTAEVYETDDGYETILTKAMQCLQGPFKRKQKPRKCELLKDASGYLMPGTLTLVLGPQGCGKSVLHRILSGNMATPKGLVTYNNEQIRNLAIHDLAAMVENMDNHLPFLTIRETIEFSRKCLAVFQEKHFGPQILEIMGDALNTGEDPKVELLLSIMGLRHVADRFVGSPLMSTITEDERRRLTAAEMFTGGHAVYFLDELNAAAEDSVTFDLLTAIRIYTRVRQTTFVASLFQPAFNVFDLFDRLIILNQGHIVYQGPRQDALPYFESIGYKKPNHVSVGEFLQEVTTADGVMYLQPNYKRMELEDFVDAYKSSDMYMDICRVLDSPELVQEIWVQGSHPLGLNFLKSRDPTEANVQPSYVVSTVADEDGSLNNISMDHTTGAQPGDKIVAFGSSTEQLQYTASTLNTTKPSEENLLSSLEEAIEPVRLQLERPFRQHTNVSFGKLYGDFVLPWKSEVILLIERELKVTWRNKFGLYVRLSQVLVLSLFVSFLLFRIEEDADQFNMNLFRTAFFISILIMTIFNLGQLPMLMDERKVYYKQKGNKFYRPISYLLGKMIGSLPFSLCEASIWTFIVYFLSHMSVSDGGWHFFVYYLVIILTALNGASMVRFFSFFAPDKEKAGMFMGLMIALFILFAGFLIPRFVVPKYWLWMYYINPLQWAITAMVINQYNSADYGELCANVQDLTQIPQCIGRANDTVGHAYLARGEFYTSNSWIAVAVAVMFGWIVLWNVFTYLVLSKLQHESTVTTVPSAESENTLYMETELEDVESSVLLISHTAIPVTISWHELCYELIVPSFRGPRNILNYISGWGEPNDMIAFLGPHAAGKTTLLNCLAGRKIRTECLRGQILVNGYPKLQKDFGHVMGYVDKIDAYTPYMTVKEILVYSATIRLGKYSSKQKKMEFVDEVIQLTKLKKFENTLVISLMNNMSFHQEKLLTIATELVANPSVLFLDDPIKGLDSLNAVQVIACLQKISKTGRLVITTLTYPSQRILSMFTKVQILKSGETVYFGPVGSNCEMVRTYFEAIPSTPPCPQDKNVSTYVLDIIGDSNTHKRPIKDYAFEYRVSQLALRNHVHLQQIRRRKGRNLQGLFSNGYAASLATMLWQTIITIQNQYWRNISYSWSRIMLYLIMGVLIGSVFYKIDVNTTPGMNSAAGAIFISCVLVGLTNAQNAIPWVSQLRDVINRERAVHQARISLYNIAFVLAEVPYLMFATLIFSSIFLPMTGLAVDSAAQFFKYWFIAFEFFLVITFFAILLAAVAPMPQIATVLVPVFVGMWVATGGLVVPRRKILPEYIWIFWTNPLQYALDGLTSVALYCDLNKPSCLNGGLNTACLTDLSACPSCDCPRLSDSPTNAFVWTQISYNRSLDYDRVPYDMLALFIYAILLRVLTYIAVKYIKQYK